MRHWLQYQQSSLLLLSLSNVNAYFVGNRLEQNMQQFFEQPKPFSFLGASQKDE